MAGFLDILYIELMIVLIENWVYSIFFKIYIDCLIQVVDVEIGGRKKIEFLTEIQFLKD